MKRFYVILLILGLSLLARAQVKKEPISMSLSADQTYFRTGGPAVVTVTFQNKTGSSFPRTNYLLDVWLILERTSVREGDGCYWNDCYRAIYYWRTNKAAIPNGGTFPIEIDLAKLQWLNMLDCGSRFSFKDQKQNFFTEVMSGNLNLKVQLTHGSHIIDSNRLLLSLETAKPYRARKAQK